MSDTASQFQLKAAAMFAAAQSKTDQIVKTWMIQFVRAVVAETPGPGNQVPADSLYIATGRLRAAWQWTSGPAPGEVDRKEGGPYDDSSDGLSTQNLLIDQIFTTSFVSEISLYNDVLYAYIVHEGMGHHHGARPWVYSAGQRSQTYLVQALQSVGSRG